MRTPLVRQGATKSRRRTLPRSGNGPGGKNANQIEGPATESTRTNFTLGNLPRKFTQMPILTARNGMRVTAFVQHAGYCECGRVWRRKESLEDSGITGRCQMGIETDRTRHFFQSSDNWFEGAAEIPVRFPVWFWASQSQAGIKDAAADLVDLRSQMLSIPAGLKCILSYVTRFSLSDATKNERYWLNNDTPDFDTWTRLFLRHASGCPRGHPRSRQNPRRHIFVRAMGDER